MKKKIFLFTVMVALLVCLFALCVSAAGFESDYTSNVTTYGEGPDWANLEDTASTAVIKKADGTALRIPAYYIFKANSKLSFDQNGSNFDFDWISEQVGEEITHISLIAIEIPAGTKSFENNNGWMNATVFPSLEEIVVPTTVSSFGSKFIRGNTVVKRIFVKQSIDSDGNIVGIKSIPAYFADQNSALEFFAFELDYVTSIGDGAFSTSKVKSLTFKGPITKIAGSAFANCPNLEIVNVNNTGDTISMGGKAFAYSPKLISVTLNGFSLGDNLFENVNGLTGGLTIIATNVVSMGDRPFKNSTNLERVEISGPITNLGSNTFSGCSNIKTVIINNTASTPATSNAAFSENESIENVTLNGIDIGYRMFYKVTTLKSLNITNYTSIGNEAFANSTITSFTILAGFTSIGERAFQNCKSLTTVTFAGNAGANAVINQAAFENCTVLTSIVIPEGVTTLGNCAFKGSGLTSVILPTTLTTLGGGEHFYNTKLTTVVGLENTKLTSISYSMFRGLSKWKPDEIRLPSTVQTIAQYGFADVGAKVFKLGAGVQKIDTEAFVNCGQVEAYYLPSTITSFGSRAFNNNVKKNFLIFVTSDDANYLGTVKTSTGAADIITKSAYEADKDAYASGIHIISGYNVCAVFYDGAHAMAGKEVMTLTSYFAPINFGDVCTRSGCGESVVTSTIAPIFTYQGYSCTEVAINGKYSMSQFFKLDDNALAQYIEKTGTTFEYGLVASVSANPLAAENEGLIASGKTIIAPSSSFAHDLFGIGLNGITTEQQKATLLSFCAYVVDGGEVFYLDNGETVKTVSQKSFNDVLNSK